MAIVAILRSSARLAVTMTELEFAKVTLADRSSTPSASLQVPIAVADTDLPAGAAVGEGEAGFSDESVLPKYSVVACPAAGGDAG
ncbi:MAG: hypothetical protein ABWZ86_02060 [Hyphomicrobium sp.]